MSTSNHLIEKGLKEKSKAKAISVMKVALLLWPVWIAFDYFLAQDLFPLFVTIRLSLVIYTGLIYWLFINNKLTNFLAQCLFLIPAFFEISFMFNTIPKEVMNFYFMGGTMVLIARFSFLMLPLKRGVFFAFFAIVSIFIMNYIFDDYTVIELISEGGILYISVALFSAFISYFQYRSMVTEVKSQIAIEETNLKLNLQKNQIIEQTKVLEERNNALNSALDQKDILLAETHHRVKNNLQIISSLIRIQQSKEENAEANEVLRVTQNRIDAMTILHEELYQSENFEEISFEAYISKIVGSLMNSYERLEIKIEIESCQEKVDLIKLIPCGLIINELVTNSIKHAFNNVSYLPEIKIEHRLDKDKNIITYKDNGVGFDNTGIKEMDFDKLKTFGLRLIQGLVNQIGGELNLNSNEEGVEFLIIF